MKQEIIKFATKTGNFLVKNSPHIFTGLAVAGVVGTIALVIKAQHEADDIVTEEESVRIVNCENDHDNEYQPVTFKERIKMTWKCYIPATISGVSTIGFIIASDTINTKRMTALSALYAASQKALEEYKASVKEVVGDKMVKEISEKKANKALEEHPLPDNLSILPRLGSGTQLCFDELSGQYFYSDYYTVIDAYCDFKKDLCNQSFAELSVNDWLTDYLNLKPVKYGCYLTYNMDHLPIMEAQWVNSNNRAVPLLCLQYNGEPHFANRYW